MGTTARKPTRTIEEAVSYAVGHRIRVEALAILNDGPASPSEIAEMIGEGLSKVGHHIKELFDSGCIELARVEKVRNSDEHFYRAVERPFISDEEARALPIETRREITGLIIQATMAEALASFWAGKTDADDDIWLGWRSLSLDAQGRREVREEQTESYERLVQIEARAAARLAESGGTGISTVIAAMGFERSRSGRPVGRRLVNRVKTE